MMKNSASYENQTGITLLETLMVVGLLSGIMLVLTTLLQDFGRREHMRNVAEQIALVERAVIESFSSLDAFSVLHEIAQSNGGVAEISILNPTNPNRSMSSAYAPTGGISLESGTVGFPPNHIVNAGYNPLGPPTYSNFRDTLPLRASTFLETYEGTGNPQRDVRLSILIHAGGVAPERTLEILIVTMDRLLEKDIRSVVKFMGASGGFVSAAPPASPNECPAIGCAQIARGALGNWSVPLEHYSGTLWYNEIATARPAIFSQSQAEGYLANYSYINEAVIAGDYLYRIAIDGNPSLNRMHTTLDLARHEIVGADNIEIRNSDGYALTAKHATHAQGSVFIGGNLSVDGDLQALGDIRAGVLSVGTRDLTSPPNATVGNIVVGKKFITNNLHTTGDMFITGSAEFRNIDTVEAMSNNLYTLGLNDNGKDGRVIIGHLTNNGDVNVKNELRAAKIETQAVNTTTVGIVQGELQGEVAGVPGTSVPSGRLQVDGALNAPSGKVFIQDDISINNLIRCESGC